VKEVWFARVNNALIATDDDSRKVIERMAVGECKAFRPIGVRDSVSHRRYWVMMTETAKNVRRIEIQRVYGQPVYMPIFDKHHAHTAMKFCTGLFDVLPVEGADLAIRVPHSTNFDEMSPEEWHDYWPKVLDVLLEKVAPEIQIPEARDAMLISIERWQAEAA
jgi:hypothetical protein